MKNNVMKTGRLLLTCTLTTLLLLNCSKDDDKAEKEEEFVIATKETLVGEWKLINSTIDGEKVESSAFEVLKESTANFYADNTYKIVKKNVSESTSGITSSTNEQSGTYSVTELNVVTFFNSSSEIKLVEKTLQITTTVSNDGAEQTQIDIFIRSDSEEFVDADKDEKEVDVTVDEEETEEETNTYDGSAVIEKLLGKWTIEDGVDDCMKKNTLEFKSEGALEFIQHKSTFNRNDLLKYNISVSYPIPAKFSASISRNNAEVVFDTEADCQFVKTSQLEYVVKDEKTISIKNAPQAVFLLEDDNTVKLIYTYTDSNSKEQTLEFTYKKE